LHQVKDDVQIACANLVCPDDLEKQAVQWKLAEGEVKDKVRTEVTAQADGQTDYSPVVDSTLQFRELIRSYHSQKALVVTIKNATSLIFEMLRIGFRIA